LSFALLPSLAVTWCLKEYCYVFAATDLLLFLYRHLMAEYALSKLNLKVAEHSFVRCKDYAGIQLVKRLSNLQVSGSC